MDGGLLNGDGVAGEACGDASVNPLSALPDGPRQRKAAAVPHAEEAVVPHEEDEVEQYLRRRNDSVFAKSSSFKRPRVRASAPWMSCHAK